MTPRSLQYHWIKNNEHTHPLSGLWPHPSHMKQPRSWVLTSAWLGLSLSLQHFLCFSGWCLSIRGKRKGILMAIKYIPTDATNCALNVWSDIISYWLGLWFRDYVCWSPWSSHREGKVHSFIFQEFSVIVKISDWTCWQWRKWNSYPFHFSSCHG